MVWQYKYYSHRLHSRLQSNTLTDTQIELKSQYILHYKCNAIGGQANRHATKIRPKAVRGGIFDRLANFDKCRSEVAGDAISSVVGMDVRPTSGGSGLNSDRNIWLFSRPDPFYASLLCSI